MTQKLLKVLSWPGWWYPRPDNPLEGIFILKHEAAVSQFADVATLYVRAADMERNGGEPFAYEYSEEVQRRVLKVFYPKAPRIPLLGKLTDFFRYLRAAQWGLTFLQERWGAPDIVHVHVNPPAGMIYLLWRQFRFIPRIHSEHWSGYLAANGAYLRSGLLRRLLTRQYIRNSAFTCPVSLDLQRAMESHGLKSRYQIVPNVVDTTVFRPDPRRFAHDVTPPEIFHLLHVSGLKTMKNVSGILRALAQLKKRRGDFCFHIAGDGEDRENLENLAIQLGLTDQFVVFHGFLSVEEVAKLMRECHIFLLFSFYENAPCVLSEAGACGLPVIAPAVGGIPEMVNPCNGRLVKCGDEIDLTGAILDVMNNYLHFDPAAIRSAAEAKYSYAVVGRRFHSLYVKALESRSP